MRENVNFVAPTFPHVLSLRMNCLS